MRELAGTTPDGVDEALISVGFRRAERGGGNGTFESYSEANRGLGKGPARSRQTLLAGSLNSCVWDRVA
jgi:hypothetical protein